MTFVEAIQRAVERPGLRVCLPGRCVIEIAATGKLMDPTLYKNTYARLSAQDVLAVTWQTLTDADLEAIAREAAYQEDVARAKETSGG